MLLKMQRLATREYKIAVIGSSGVGKSSLCLQFARNKFPNSKKLLLTNYYRKQVSLDNEHITIHILDTNGNEKTTNDFISQAHGFIIVFDITKSNTLIEVDNFYQLVRTIKNCFTVPLVLVGNKFDLNDIRLIGNENAQRVALNLKCQYYEVSAKTKFNIDLIFIECVRVNKRQFFRVRSTENTCCRCSVV
ncbi:hypothetical protein SteCoe_34178 [Stentor coeruleus]|uniref:Uncharacterized protein n=1 Tax=Stentor coeruleus TaxID=5963 RepID=A0A1R2AV35_9CILI|nr:hypothetical protein SteCoe_34178 [Stentor coeruleus]